jgi:valyl-tRNA synthetase
MSDDKMANISTEANNASEGESKNKAKNDAKRAAKMEKFLAKQAKAEQFKSVSAVAAKPKTLEISKVVVTDDTPVGEKKDMTKPMASSYDPIAVEAAWYAWWEKSGFFKPECFGDLDGSRETFCIVMPPPNVTGSLHLGHATMLSIEDAIVRWNRMKGKATLFVPGCDHAGIATQAVVEKKLKKEFNKTRHDFGREAFVTEVWKWKDEYGHRIYDQLRRMGASADWERACFTLDPHLNKAVVEAFIRMFNEGLIFRSNRLVNWCGHLKTSLSDLEVDMKEIEGGAMLPAHGHDPKKRYKFGMMTYFAYKVENGEDEIVIATTRPETVFADTAVCVNPNDERYKKYHGKNVIHPVLGHSIPVICDEAAEIELGTGALKVSPAHDATDFVLGQKHKLKFVVIYDENNILNENCGPFAGMARYDAREAVIEFTKKNGTFRDEKLYPMSIPICSRSGDFVEPRLIPQWWLDCKDMAQKSVDVVRNGMIDISPKEHEKIWYHWLENIRDWCLSRQLWWGHRIPAYLVHVEGQNTKLQSLEEQVWIAARNEQEALELARQKLSDVDANKISVSQDEDVLDTWFSSGLWPFSTLGWPDKTPDFANFYPNQLMETGSDILFFWVARMVMMSIHLTGQIPFSKVFLHAIVRDAHGRKMSKSLGNVIDPLDVIEGITLNELQARLDQGNLDANEVKAAKEGQKCDFPHGIPQCGTDALRFALCSYISEGRDINMNINRVEGYRRFCNKLWNATRFALMKLGNEYQPEAKICLFGKESMIDKWILSRLNKAIEETNKSLESYNLMAATQAIHAFWLYELCDVYIEAIKPICTPDNPDKDSRLCATNVLYICLEQGLRLLHPFMPFVTEELYQLLPRRPNDTIPTIMLTLYPSVLPIFEHDTAERDFSKIFEVIKTVRRIASESKVPKNTTVLLSSANKDSLSLLQSQESALSSLVRSIGGLQISDDTAKDGQLIEAEVFLKFAPPTGH